MCFCFVGLPFFPSASWPLSFLSLFLSFSSSSDLAWFMRECLTGVGLLCMDTLSCIHGHTFLHSWSGPMTLVVCLLHGTTLLSNLPVVLILFFYMTLVVGKDTYSKPDYSNNIDISVWYNWNQMQYRHLTSYYLSFYPSVQVLWAPLLPPPIPGDQVLWAPLLHPPIPGDQVRAPIRPLSGLQRQ